MYWVNGTEGVLRTNTLDLTLAQRIIGAAFDGFGLINRGGLGDDLADNATLFIDELTYSVGGSVMIRSVEVVSGSQLKLTFCSAGTTHKVQQRSNVSSGSWTDVPSVTLTGPVNSLVWTAQFALPSGERYYRVVANPSP